ncbi:hypothetical protein LOS58_004678 [Salmonella enterica]|nr:hypothetical protein [Salmonella enterica]
MERLAEIFLLGQMRPLADKLMALTSVRLPEPDTTVEEINLLLERCAVIYNREVEEYDRSSREASRAEHALMMFKQPVQSVADSRSRNKTSLHSAEDDADRAAAYKSQQGKRVNDMRGLTGLLYQEARRFGDAVDINRFFPRADNSLMPRAYPLPEIFTRRDEFLFIAAHDTCNAINSLRLAAEDIVRKCTPPKQDTRSPIQRNNFSHVDIIKSQAYRHYYQADNDLLRAIVSADDYAKYIAEFGWFMRESREATKVSLQASVSAPLSEEQLNEWKEMNKENEK